MTAIDRRWRAVLTLVLAIYGYLCLRSPGDYRWLDGLDLAIHEYRRPSWWHCGERATGTEQRSHSGGWARTAGTSRFTSGTRDGALADAVHLVLRHEPQQKLATDEHRQLHG